MKIIDIKIGVIFLVAITSLCIGCTKFDDIKDEESGYSTEEKILDDEILKSNVEDEVIKEENLNPESIKEKVKTLYESYGLEYEEEYYEKDEIDEGMAIFCYRDYYTVQALDGFNDSDIKGTYVLTANIEGLECPYSLAKISLSHTFNEIKSGDVNLEETIIPKLYSIITNDKMNTQELIENLISNYDEEYDYSYVDYSYTLDSGEEITIYASAYDGAINCSISYKPDGYSDVTKKKIEELYS